MSRPPPGAERFRFRFLIRGDRAASLLTLALLSLHHCHPGSAVVVVDAGDQPFRPDAHLRAELARPGRTVVHCAPPDDAVSAATGRGSARHLYYWRHSPTVLAALPPFSGIDVHVDADLLFLRPLDLAALVGPLGRGRIAATIDESSLEHYAQVDALVGTASAPTWPRTGGPLWQTGLIFSNPEDDGGLYDLFWAAAVRAAAEGWITALPGDDMAVFAWLLGAGGPMWERALALGHDWNFITDAAKDSGVFGRVAHFGGHRAKQLLVERIHLAERENRTDHGWGTVDRATADGDRAPAWGLWGGASDPEGLQAPFCLTWPIPLGEETLRITWETLAERPVHVAVHLDGRASDATTAARGEMTLPVDGAGTVTVIALDPADRRARIAVDVAATRPPTVVRSTA